MVFRTLKPFGAYIDGIRSAAVQARSGQSELVDAENALAGSVKAHLLSYYEGVTAEHSFQDEHGRIFDCVPISAQPAAKLVEGDPVAPFSDEPSPALRALLEVRSVHSPRIPEGTVPIERLTLEDAGRFTDLRSFLQLGQRKDKPATGGGLAGGAFGALADYPHRYAVAYQRVPNSGGRSVINLWKPSVASPQIMSLSQIWCSSGSEADGTLQTAEAGWQVCEANFPESGGNPVFFIYWTADNYRSTGAYNNRDGKFFIKSAAFPIGGIFNVTSVPGGVQYDIDVAYAHSAGNWWLYVGGVALGFWPNAIFNGGAMSLGGQEVMCGGETDGAADYPPMGSGAVPGMGYAHAAYHRGVAYYDAAQHTVDATLQALAPTPASCTISLQQPAPPAGGYWGSFFYCGGIGGR